jgi:hypothetical protein
VQLRRAEEFALIFSSYNLKRVMSILGVKAVIQRLKGLKAHFLVLWCIVVPVFQPPNRSDLITDQKL